MSRRFAGRKFKDSETMQLAIARKLFPWLPALAPIVGSIAVNACGLLMLSFPSPRIEPVAEEPNTPQQIEVSLSSPATETVEGADSSPKQPEPFAQPFVIQNNLPTDLFSDLKPEEKKPNGLLDLEEGGTLLRPEGVHSGGGGGDGADSLAFGHIATDDRVWARMKVKTDPNSNAKAAGDESGRGTSVPGVLKIPGAGEGLGNGKGSGALGSQGSGTGSGAGTDGSNIGQGLGKAPMLGVSRKPGVISMNRGNYPSEARQAHHEGTVMLAIEVLPSGSVGKVEVKTPSGFDELDQAAVTVTKTWQFICALQDGKPVAFWYSIPYRFVLTDQ